MATLTEKIDSREWSTGQKPSVTMHYILDGTADDIEARDLLLATTPQVYNGLVRDDCTLDPIFVDTVIGRGKWECSVRYTRPDFQPPQVGESSFSFDTGGGTQHVTQSLQTVSKYPVSAPNFEGAIGVTHDSVDGVDITVPVYNFSETHYLADSAVTETYKQTLFLLTGKVNSVAWRTFAAGEVLFLGASGSKRGEEDWEISYRFAASPNRTGLTVGSITGIDKRGWEYMWVRYADGEDEAAHAMVKKPVAVYIEKVYEEADLAGLGI